MPQMNDPTFTRFLIDALKQRSMSPEPSYAADPSAGAAVPPQQAPMQVPDPALLGGGIANQGAEAIRRAQIEKAMQMQQMGMP